MQKKCGDAGRDRLACGQMPGERTLTALTCEYARCDEFQVAVRPRELQKGHDSKLNKRRRIAFPQVSAVDEKWWRVDLYAGFCIRTKRSGDGHPSRLTVTRPL
jgi:hypothetical protein